MLMPVIDDLVNDPIGAITQLLDDISNLDAFTGTGDLTDLAALIAIQNALGELIEAVGTILRGLHSEWLQVVPDAQHPVRQALDAWLASITAAQTALTGSTGLDTQVVSFLAALEAVRSVLQPLTNGSVATSVAIYDLAQRTLPALDAAQQAAQALQEKLP